jgi:hypothetical protein
LAWNALWLGIRIRLVCIFLSSLQTFLGLHPCRIRTQLDRLQIKRSSLPFPRYSRPLHFRSNRWFHTIGASISTFLWVLSSNRRSQSRQYYCNRLPFTRHRRLLPLLGK